MAFIAPWKEVLVCPKIFNRKLDTSSAVVESDTRILPPCDSGSTGRNLVTNLLSWLGGRLIVAWSSSPPPALRGLSSGRYVPWSRGATVSSPALRGLSAGRFEPWSRGATVSSPGSQETICREIRALIPGRHCLLPRLSGDYLPGDTSPDPGAPLSPPSDVRGLSAVRCEPWSQGATVSSPTLRGLSAGRYEAWS